MGVVEPGINLYFTPPVEMVSIAMHNNFISVVSVLNSAAQLPDFITVQAYPLLNAID